jgi:hypothetical protein
MGRTGHERSCATDRRLGVEAWPDAYSESYAPILPEAVERLEGGTTTHLAHAAKADIS